MGAAEFAWGVDDGSYKDGGEGGGEGLEAQPERPRRSTRTTPTLSGPPRHYRADLSRTTTSLTLSWWTWPPILQVFERLPPSSLGLGPSTARWRLCWPDFRVTPTSR